MKSLECVAAAGGLRSVDTISAAPLAVQQQVAPEQETSSGSFWQYGEILRRRKKIILGFCFLGTAVVAILSSLMTPLYKATTTIVIEGEGSDVLNPSQDSSRGVSFDVFENYIETQMSLIRSRNVAGKVFQELGLEKLPRYRPHEKARQKIVKTVSDQMRGALDLSSGTSGRVDPLKLFLKDIGLERLKGTRAVQISVFNPDAQLAADTANALARHYSQENLMRRANSYIRNQRMAALNADYMRLQSQYDYLSNIYGPKHHKMLALNTEIRGLSDRIAAEQSKIASGEIDPSLTKAGNKESQKLLGEILKTIQDVSVRSSSQMNNVEIADPAVPPKEIAFPKKGQAILLGFVGSLLAGIFLAYLIEYLDDTIKDQEDLKKVIGRALYVGAVPFEERVKGFNRLSKMDRLMMHRPLSGSAEAYRLIRMHLQWFMEKEPAFKDFAVVSSIPGEGKSTIASNLAVSIAQLEKRVLLVDADVRRGRLHRTYGMHNKKGLGQYLIGAASFEDILQETSTPNVWMITPGRDHMLGSELLSSPMMTEFIRNTRRHFDMVLYDTPPITLISDTSVLLSQICGAMLVCRTGVTKSQLVKKSLSMIHSTGTRLLGVVLNCNVETESHKYYSMYYRD